jgi:hypothetical protein
MAPCGPSKSYKLLFMKEMLVGAVGIEPTTFPVRRVTVRIKRVPARRAPRRNGSLEEFRSNPVYLQGTACGRLEAYSRDRCHRYIEGSPGGRDSLLSIDG